MTSDDEAAQYYDKLTSLFQETRQKLKEFNEDFNRRGSKSNGGGAPELGYLKQHRNPVYSSIVSVETHQRSSAKVRDSLLEDLQKSKSPFKKKEKRNRQSQLEIQ